MDLILATAFGTFAGAFVGLIPGFGMSSMLLLSAPLLIQHSVVSCIIFYCCACSAAQYFGSVTTIGLRVPGESTSVPLLEVIKKTDRLGDLFFITSFGSLVGSIVSGVLIVGLFSILSTSVFYMKTMFLFWFSMLGVVMCVVGGGNHPLVSMMLLVLGWCVAKVGYDGVHNVDFMTFGNQYLYGGIPTLPVLLGIYAIPGLVALSRMSQVSYVNLSVATPKLALITSSFITIIQSSIIGFVSGLIPYVGSGISSLVAYLFSKKTAKDHIQHAVASETANNAASISVLVPLLFLGIAIVPSEFLLLEILPFGNLSFSAELLKFYLPSIALCIVASNLISFATSWKLASQLTSIVSKTKQALPIVLAVAMFCSVLYIGSEYNQGLYYLIVLAVFSGVGLLLRDYNSLPFVYGLLLQNSFEGTLYKVIQLYL